MNTTINRYDDHEYLVHSSELKRDIVLRVEGASVENEYELVKTVVEKALKTTGLETKNKITYLERNWQLESDTPGGVMKLLASATSIVHKQGDTGLHRFILKGDAPAPKRSENLFLQELRAQVPGATDGELQKGVRGIFSQDDSNRAFNDPFTQAASHAYAHSYERNYSAKDNVTPSDSDCCILATKDSAMLVLGRDKSLVTTENNKQTVSQYREFLVAQFGSDKVDEVAGQFGISFDAMLEKGESLTPEHVYRMNIGLSYVDVDDLKGVLSKLPKLKEFLESMPEDNECSISDISKATGISQHALNTLQKALSFKRESTSSQSASDTESGAESDIEQFTSDILDWLVQFDPMPTTLADCTEKQVQALMQPFTLDDAAQDRAFTGRKILKPLLSGYSTAELGQEKLWVDKQEFLQALQIMRKTDNMDLWIEKFDHVIVKANLLKGSNEKGFTIATLIPALKAADGTPRWYHFTRCMSNGYGIFTYTVEPVAKDSKLPGIYTGRSTASSEYALHGKDSVLNDLNALNPPGYEGQVLSSPYDAKFFKKYTMPTWVGHALQGQKLLESGQPDEAYSALRKANKALLGAFDRKLATHSLDMIAREYDWLLNRVGLELSYGKWAFGGYLGIYNTIMKRGSDYVDTATELKDAKVLKDQLEKARAHFASDTSEAQYILEGIDRVIGELDHYIIDRSHVKAEGQMRNQYMAETHSELDMLEGQVQKANQYGYKDQIPDLVKTWAEKLLKRADDNQELPKYKNLNGLLVTGQSLGGAISQVAMCRQLVALDRIPVTEVHNYTISSPGIRHMDTEAFIAYAGSTQELREALGSKLSITHLTEAGDFVFLTGQGHLGAAHTTEDAEVLAKAIQFRGEVREMIPGALPYSVVHETQFMDGKEGEHYLKEVISTTDLGKIDDAENVIAKNKPMQKELLQEAKAHKARFKYSTFLDEKLLAKIPKNSHLIKRHLHQQRQVSPGQKQRDTQGVFIVE